MIEGFDNLFSILNPRERRVLDILADHRGMGQAIHIPALAAQAGIPDRSLQFILKNLVEAYGLNVASSLGCGPFMITTLAEADAVYQHQRARGLSNLVHAAAVRRIALTMFGGDLAAAEPQLKLFLELYLKEAA